MTRGISRSGGSGRAAAAGAVFAVVAVAVVNPATEAAVRPTVIAHRGDRAAAPENTNAAFLSAIDRGADAVEMDIRFSRTAYPVVMHDATLDRTTNCAGPVSAFSRTEMRRCDAGSWFGARYRGERIPNLNMALRAVSGRSPSTKVLLHMKVVPDGKRAQRVMDAVRRYKMLQRTIIIADAPSILSRMRSVGFTELGLVFSTPAGWRRSYGYMIPYGVPLDPRGIAATHRRGGKVWPVVGRPAPLTDLLAPGTVDGLLVDRLAAMLPLPVVQRLAPVEKLPKLSVASAAVPSP